MYFLLNSAKTESAPQLWKLIALKNHIFKTMRLYWLLCCFVKCWRTVWQIPSYEDLEKKKLKTDPGDVYVVWLRAFLKTRFQDHQGKLTLSHWLRLLKTHMDIHAHVLFNFVFWILPEPYRNIKHFVNVRTKRFWIVFFFIISRLQL